MNARLSHRTPLAPHPTSAPGAVRDLSISAVRDGNFLVLSYRLVGDLDALLLPDRCGSARVDELWRHTCFEVFIGHGASGEYLEYNFSPSGEWAAYRFSGYRAGMQTCELAVAPSLRTHVAVDTFELDSRVDLRGLPLARGGTLGLGVTAVIEDEAGVLSYWALKHPAEKPDFHHPDSFVLDIH
jgi:hypothetical protein